MVEYSKIDDFEDETLNENYTGDTESWGFETTAALSGDSSLYGNKTIYRDDLTLRANYLNPTIKLNMKKEGSFHTIHGTAFLGTNINNCYMIGNSQSVSSANSFKLYKIVSGSWTDLNGFSESTGGTTDINCKIWVRPDGIIHYKTYSDISMDTITKSGSVSDNTYTSGGLGHSSGTTYSQMLLIDDIYGSTGDSDTNSPENKLTITRENDATTRLQNNNYVGQSFSFTKKTILTKITIYGATGGYYDNLNVNAWIYPADEDGYPTGSFIEDFKFNIPSTSTSYSFYCASSLNANTDYVLVIQGLGGTFNYFDFKRNTGSSYSDGTAVSSSDGSSWSQISNSDFWIDLDGYTVDSEGTNTQINIGDVWKEISEIKINIGDVWKTVEGMQINIGDTWKTIF